MPVATQLIGQLKHNSSTDVDVINIATGCVRSEIIEASQPDKVNRCIYLLEHIGNCQNIKSCIEGEGCFRTKKVVFHYLNCPKTKSAEKCSICLQLLALCQIHAERCQSNEGCCSVPACHNRKQPGLLSKKPLTSMDLTREAYKQMLVKLGKTLRMPSTDEKKQNLLELLKGDQRTALKLLRDLHKLKRAKTGANQVVPTWPVNRQAAPTCGREVASGIQTSEKKINSYTVYNGRIVIRPI